MKLRWSAVVLAVILLFSGGCTPSPQPETSRPTMGDELRGVWLSFLDLEPLLTEADPDTAAARLDAVMDTCREAGLNTVFFHARSHGDAYYASSVYPAAVAAAPLLRAGFDPLAYAVQAAHDRGLALHAWVNPYRLGEAPYGDACFEKDGVWYADPSSAAARGRVLEGVRELLTGYAVDGIHFDDYFYPPGMDAAGEAFESIPEGMDVVSWRQTQVDLLVSSTYSLCRQAGRRFGISPMAALERCRTEACADVARWMAQPGYLDYVCPQIYTGWEHETAPFSTVLETWATLPRREGVALYVGLALYKAGLAEDTYAGSGSGEWAAADDILSRQVTALRQKAAGFVLFRYEHLQAPMAAEEMRNLQKVI